VLSGSNRVVIRPFAVRSAIALAALTLGCLTVSGCVNTGRVALTDTATRLPEASDQELTTRTIAIDLVSALIQIPGFDAWSMTVQLTPTQSDFGRALKGAFRDAGYGVQMVDADQGRNYVSYRQTLTDGESADKPATFELSIRTLTLKRNYRYSKGRWTPASLLIVQGVAPTPVLMHDDLHRQNGVTERFPTGVFFLDESGGVVDMYAAGSSPARSSGARLGERIAEERFLIISRSQLFTRQRSAASLDNRSYRPVSQLVLRFPTTDPNILGEPNKRAVSALLETFRSESDRLSIQGCSHGKSLVWDGTESVSLERQQRVNQELLVAGVAENRIREEGCFSTAFEGRLPRQSVILTLRRAG